MAHENQNEQIKKLCIEFDWLNAAIDNAPNIHTSGDVIAFTTGMYHMCLYSDFETANLILDNIDVKEFSELMMISLIRITFQYRESLPAWHSCLNSIKDEMDRLNKPTKSLLAGLI